MSSLFFFIFAELGTSKLNSHACIYFTQITLHGSFCSVFSPAIKLSCCQYVFRHNSFRLPKLVFIFETYHSVRYNP